MFPFVPMLRIWVWVTHWPAIDREFWLVCICHASISLVTFRWHFASISVASHWCAETDVAAAMLVVMQGGAALECTITAKFDRMPWAVWSSRVLRGLAARAAVSRSVPRMSLEWQRAKTSLGGNQP